jgi:hypothetical protein
LFNALRKAKDIDRGQPYNDDLLLGQLNVNGRAATEMALLLQRFNLGLPSLRGQHILAKVRAHVTFPRSMFCHSGAARQSGKARHGIVG